METKNFNFPLPTKYILRSTGEEIEVVAFNLPHSGGRTPKNELTPEAGDWITYIDTKGEEHIKEPLNIQLDCKPSMDNAFTDMLKHINLHKMPSTRNNRIFEMVKALVRGREFIIDDIIKIATEIVDKIGTEYETDKSKC